MASLNELEIGAAPSPEKTFLPERSKFPKKTLVILAAILILAASGYLGYVILSYWQAQRLVQAGVNYYTQGDFTKAKESFKKSIRYYSRDPIPYAYLGMMTSPDFPEPVTRSIINRRTIAAGINLDYYPGLYRESLNYYEKAFSLGLAGKKFPDYIALLHDAATAYRLWEEYDKAAEKYLEEIRLNPDSSFWARYWVARDYYGRANKPKEALEMMTSAINSKDADQNQLYRAYSSLSNYYWYFEDNSNMEKYARLALQSAPQNPKKQDDRQEVEYIHTLLAELAGRQGNLTLAESEIEKANRLAGREVYVCDLAKIYYENGLYDKAVTEAEKMRILGPASRPCLWVLGMAYFKKGDEEQAKKYFNDFLHLADETKIKSANFWKQIDEVKTALGGL